MQASATASGNMKLRQHYEGQLSITSCPECHTTFDEFYHRPVQDGCGHAKCITCLVKFRHVCGQCKRKLGFHKNTSTSTPSEPTQVSPVLHIAPPNAQILGSSGSNNAEEKQKKTGGQNAEEKLENDDDVVENGKIEKEMKEPEQEDKPVTSPPAEIEDFILESAAPSVDAEIVKALSTPILDPNLAKITPPTTRKAKQNAVAILSVMTASFSSTSPSDDSVCIGLVKRKGGPREVAAPKRRLALTLSPKLPSEDQTERRLALTQPPKLPSEVQAEPGHASSPLSILSPPPDRTPMTLRQRTPIQYGSSKSSTSNNSVRSQILFSDTTPDKMPQIGFTVFSKRVRPFELVNVVSSALVLAENADDEQEENEDQETELSSFATATTTTTGTKSSSGTLASTTKKKKRRRKAPDCWSWRKKKKTKSKSQPGSSSDQMSDSSSNNLFAPVSSGHGLNKSGRSGGKVGLQDPFDFNFDIDFGG